MLRRSHRRENPRGQSKRASPVTDELVEVDQQLALLQTEVTKLTQRRARLIHRPERQPPPQQGNYSQPRFAPSSLNPPKPVPSVLTHQELLQFVVQQLQNLVSVLAAQLR